MAIRPLRWQGKARVEQLRTHVESRMREWARNWCVNPGGADMSVRAVSLDELPATSEQDAWFACEAGGGVLRIRTAADVRQRLACRLSGIPDEDSGALAEGIGRRALNDLLRAIVQVAGDGKVSALATSPHTDGGLSARFGMLGLAISIGACTIDLYLDEVLCGMLVPVASTTEVKLISRVDAVMPAEITLSAVLDLGRASLDETATLKVGDVIKTNSLLSSRIQVCAEPGRPAFTGMLVVDGESRALRCAENFVGKGAGR